jgi:hypothetical protein
MKASQNAIAGHRLRQFEAFDSMPADSMRWRTLDRELDRWKGEVPVCTSHTFLALFEKANDFEFERLGRVHACTSD